MCYEGINSPQAHNGDTCSAYPWPQTPQCLWHAFYCGNFNQPIDKASCDAFQLCSAPPGVAIPNECHIPGNAIANIRIFLQPPSFLGDIFLGDFLYGDG